MQGLYSTEILFHYIVCFVILLKTYSDIRKRKFICILDTCNIGIAFYLFLIPGLYYMLCDESEFDLLKFYDEYGMYKSFFFSIICYVCLNIGYKSMKYRCRSKIDEPAVNVVRYSFLLLVLSACGLYFWSQNFGGLASLLLNAGSIRSGFIEASNGTAFFKHFVPLSKLLAIFLFNYLFVFHKQRHDSMSRKLLLYILFVVSLIISFVFILADDSRSSFGLFLFMFVVSKMLYSISIKHTAFFTTFTKTALLVLFIVFLILNGDMILGYFRGTDIETEGNEHTFAESFCHNFRCIINSPYYACYYLEKMNGNLMIWDDIQTGLTSWFPTSLKPFPDAVRTWDLNTVIHKIRTPLWGQFPHSIIANSLYDLSYFGIVIIPFLFGAIAKRVDVYFMSRIKNVFYFSVYCLLLMSFANFIQGFCLYYIIFGLFYIVLGLLIYKYVL